MEKYFVNNTPQPNGDHEVHKSGCYWLNQANSVEDLGYHASCHSAVAKAKLRYATANGCKTCSFDCHTT